MDKLRISTLNCEGIRRSRDYLNDYLTDASCDILCIQESWHLDENIAFFGTVHTDYLYTAISGVDSRDKILTGRCKGGVGTFYKKSLCSKIKPVTCKNRRICAATINLADNFSCLLLSLYLPCDNYSNAANADYVDCIDCIESLLISEHCNAFICCGDYNTSFERNNAQTECLNNFIERNNLVVSWNHPVSKKDHTYTNFSLNQFSCIDHIITTHNIYDCILDNYVLSAACNPSSHNVVSLSIVVTNFSNVIESNCNPACTPNCIWSKASIDDIKQYQLVLDNKLQLIDINLFSDISVTPGVKCNNPNCNLASHKSDIDCLFKKICDSLENASKHCIPSNKIDFYKEHIVPGFNEHVKELHTIARHDYIAWRSAGKPRFGEICLSMNQSRLRFKSALKFCQNNVNQMKADALARSMMNNDMNEFWKDVKKNTNSNVSLATNVDGSVGDTEIANMWKCHYKSLLNSVQNEESKKSVMLDINQQHETSITITPFNILDALKSIKCGKSSGVDGISAEHFVFAHSRIHVLLSLLFSAFITHGYLPDMFMKTAIVPIIKNKTGDTSDKNNYRPIALVTAASKVFELCLSIILEDYLVTHDQQFGFKRKHSTDLCIFTVKSVTKYYTQENSPVFTCFLDASKAFDKINHYTLFQKLLDRETPIILVRILLFWYTKQTMCVKWGNCMSDYFYVSNGVRQGGILSPKLYSVYVDDLSDYLVKSQIGCHIDNVCVNHVMYADDICLMAPSPAALQKLINICYDFSIQNNLSFNSTKSFCMVFKPRLYNLVCPTFYMNTEILDYAANIKYLGFTFSSDKKDDSDMLRQMRVFYTKANRLLRLFHCCSTDVKLALFRSYCACFYCPFLWTHYKKSTHSKLRVAFNNVHRRILKLPPRSSASTMYAVNHIDSFEILIRKRVVGFIERLKVSNNSIISCIDNSWKMKFEIWNPWIKLLYK